MPNWAWEDDPMKVEVKYLPTCQVGVPDGEGDIENCGEPAAALVTFEDGSSLYVCTDHFFKLTENELYYFEEEDDE